MKENNECSFCLTDFEKEDEIRLTTCFHLFHELCLESWMKKHANCPFCRKNHDLKTLEAELN